MSWYHKAVAAQEAEAKKPVKPKKAEPSASASNQGEKINMAQKKPKKAPVVASADERAVRLIFPAPASMAAAIETSWHKNRDRSLSAAIRRLLERALLDEGAEK